MNQVPLTKKVSINTPALPLHLVNIHTFALEDHRSRKMSPCKHKWNSRWHWANCIPGKGRWSPGWRPRGRWSRSKRLSMRQRALIPHDTWTATPSHTLPPSTSPRALGLPSSSTNPPPNPSSCHPSLSPHLYFPFTFTLHGLGTPTHPNSVSRFSVNVITYPGIRKTIQKELLHFLFRKPQFTSPSPSPSMG